MVLETTIYKKKLLMDLNYFYFGYKWLDFQYLPCFSIFIYTSKKFDLRNQEIEISDRFKFINNYIASLSIRIKTTFFYLYCHLNSLNKA